MPYLNFAGAPMPESASPTSNVFGTSAGGETLTAPAGPSSVDSGGGAGDVLVGSSGDNIFYVKDPSDVVRVDPGLSGTKTVVAYTSFALPAGVQNLTSSGAFNFAAGNSLDNLIVVGTLSGGPGADTFHSFAGAGIDRVIDFNAAEGDRVQLDPGTSYTVAQQGADVVIDLGNGDEMILQNVQLSSLPSGWIFTG